MLEHAPLIVLHVNGPGSHIHIIYWELQWGPQSYVPRAARENSAIHHASNNSISSASNDRASGKRGEALHLYGTGRLEVEIRINIQTGQDRDRDIRNHSSIDSRVHIKRHR